MKSPLPSRGLVKAGAIAYLLFFVLEIVIDVSLSASLPGYAWYRDSISQLGHGQSPFADWVTIWGICFFVLLVLFSLGFNMAYHDRSGALWASLMIGIYALGEGLGSGLFPLDPPGGEPTWTTHLHNLFSGVGDLGLVAFPFFLPAIFPKKNNLLFRKYLWFSIFFGLATLALFLLAKYAHQPAAIANFKGLWQRLYLLNYHFLLLMVAFKMLRMPNDHEPSDHPAIKQTNHPTSY